MIMGNEATCPDCGTAIPSNAPLGVCPKCLIGLATKAPKAEGKPASSSQPPTHSLSANTVRYFGDYELLERIAEGGMGVVYRARQVSLNRLVALKMVRLGQFASESQLRRFRIEAEAAGQLGHEHIVHIHEIGVHDGQSFFSMDLIEGGDLSQHISNLKSPMASRDAAKLLATIARAVHHAHQRGVLHRDLKPANILLDRANEPHITDFGLAKLIETDSSLTLSHAVLGTPAYMAPEQAAGKAKEISTATDLYSLGAILYELLTGQPPFTGATPAEIVRKVIDEEPVPPHLVSRSSRREEAQTSGAETLSIKESQSLLTSAATRIDKDLETICLKCLEKDPARRYSTADALAEELERWLRGEPILARPVTFTERLWKWTRRHPAVSALLAIIVLGALTSAGAILWQWHRAEQGWSTVRRANTQLLLQRAEENFSKDDSSAAFATLARAMRGDSGNRIVEERLANALNLRRFLVPALSNSPRFDLSQNPQATARIARRGPVSADASNATNIVVTGQQFADGPFLLTPPQPGVIRYIAISPDTHWVAAVVADVGVCVWDIRSRQHMATLVHPASATVVEFDPAAFFIATGSEDGAIRLWNLRQNDPLNVITVHHGPVNALRFSTDGRVLFSAGEDGVIRSWYPGRSRVAAEPNRVGTAIDDLRLGGDNTLGVRLRGDQALHFSTPKFPSLRELAAVDPALADRTTPNLIAIESVLGHPATNFHAQPITCTNFSPNGRFMVTASADGTARIWDMRTVQPLAPPLLHEAPVNHARFSPDGLRLATSTASQKARVWDAATGAPLTDWLETTEAIFSVRFSDNGQAVITSNGQHWSLHRSSATTPEWLPTVVENLVGQRITPGGVTELIPHTEAATAIRRITTETSSTHWPWLNNLTPTP